MISSPEIRNLSNDLNVFKGIANRYKKNTGSSLPTIFTLNKADTLGNPRDWPPEQSARKAGLIKEALDYLTSDVFGLSSSNIDLNNPIKGYKLEDDTYIGVIPALGINVAAGYGLRIAVQQILKFVPFGGWAVSGTIASTGTRLIGKSAEAYFFNG